VGYRWREGELLENDLLHRAFTWSSLLGFFAVETGWIVIEAGRQPWVVQGVMKTSTIDEVAAALDCARSTAGELLRKAESTVVSESFERRVSSEGIFP
jgi:cytochrome bd-type quinol oxidase subunit 1